MSARKGRVPIADQSLTTFPHPHFAHQLIEQLVAGNQLVVRIMNRLNRLRIVGERLFATADFFQYVDPGDERVLRIRVWPQRRLEIPERVLVPTHVGGKKPAIPVPSSEM